MRFDDIAQRWIGNEDDVMDGFSTASTQHAPSAFNTQSYVFPPFPLYFRWVRCAMRHTVSGQPKVLARGRALLVHGSGFSAPHT